MVILPKAGTLILAVASLVNCGHLQHNWTLAAANIAPDGFNRSSALVNGQFPGPLLTANKGDRITVNVNNRLTDPTMRRSTSIHWHGIFQPRNAFNDGPSFVTQCPIAPNHSYPYSLVLGEQTGTYWYHSHLSTQYVDGIRGPIVIYDPDDPLKHLYDVDDKNTVITLADWYHNPALNSTNKFLSGGPQPAPDSGLINGAGRFSSGPTNIPRSRINVTCGKRYRFRIVSLSASGFFNFTIENHTMTIIEADGIAHEPYAVKSVPVLPGQRYSAIVTANQSVDNYWISAQQTVLGNTSSPGNPNFNGTDTYAVLHYSGAPDTEPTTPQLAGPPDDEAFQEFNLKPLVDPGAPGGSGPPDKAFNFTIALGSPTGDEWTVNNSSYKSPDVPTLLNILANGLNKDSQFARSENTFVIPSNATIEVLFLSTAGHAFHLHGHTFDVIQSASGGPPNYVNPPRRDVVASGGKPGAPLRLRFQSNNAGPWLFHCHIEWHLVAGLALVFAEDPSGMVNGTQSIHPNKAWEDLCNIYNGLDPSFQ